MHDVAPLIDTRQGFARFINDMPALDEGYNFSDDEACTIDATNDWEALLAFLNEYKDSDKTFRSYATEIERLCLWIVLKSNIPLSGLKRTNIDEYCKFLERPEPKWIGPSSKKFKKDGSIDLNWRPFKKSKDGSVGLAPATIKRVRKILQSLFNYLVESGYLHGNPAISRRTKGQRSAKNKKLIERYLEPNETIFIENVLGDDLINKKKNGEPGEFFKALRRLYVFQLFLHTGLRISEPVNYTMGDIKIKGSGDNKTFYINICGKGNIEDEERTVTLGKNFVVILRTYRTLLNDAISSDGWLPIDPLPAFNEPTPLIPNMTGKSPVSDRQISNIFSEIREIAVCAVENIISGFNGNSEELTDIKRMRSKFTEITCHWMRHTHATYLAAVSEDIKVVQEQLGHSDLSTTQIYLHTLDRTKQIAANEFDVSRVAKLLS